LDATQGQNALVQARTFAKAVDVSGIFLAKLDGTARGGIVVAIAAELGIPLKLIGLGERPEDIEPFDPSSFVAGLFDEQ
jgi:fused signal recognition particle receptor